MKIVGLISGCVAPFAYADGLLLLSRRSGKCPHFGASSFSINWTTPANYRSQRVLCILFFYLANYWSFQDWKQVI